MAGRVLCWGGGRGCWRAARPSADGRLSPTAEARGSAYDGIQAASLPGSPGGTGTSGGRSGLERENLVPSRGEGQGRTQALVCVRRGELSLTKQYKIMKTK